MIEFFFEFAKVVIDRIFIPISSYWVLEKDCHNLFPSFSYSGPPFCKTHSRSKINRGTVQDIWSCLIFFGGWLVRALIDGLAILRTSPDWEGTVSDVDDIN